MGTAQKKHDPALKQLVPASHSSHHPHVSQGLLLVRGTQARVIFGTGEVPGSEVYTSLLPVNLLPEFPYRNIKPSRRRPITPGGYQPNPARCRLFPGSCQTSDSHENQCHRRAFGSASKTSAGFLPSDAPAPPRQHMSTSPARAPPKLPGMPRRAAQQCQH